jgi:hypothetical protein
LLLAKDPKVPQVQKEIQEILEIRENPVQDQ